jgi:4'-phosphopantetheinyl transferase
MVAVHESRPGEATAAVPALHPDACQVWWADPAGARSIPDRLLGPDELNRRGRLRQAADRDRLTVGYALARLVLAAHLGRGPADVGFERTCRYCGRPHGKPRLAGPDDGGLRFSISHAGDRVVVAVLRGAAARSDLGVDVEREQRDLDVDAVARGVLAEAETGVLARADRVPAFLAYWTRKEAILKATGEGLRVRMSDLTVSGPDAAPKLLRWAGRSRAGDRFRLYDLHPGPGYRAALATVDAPEVRVQELDGAVLLEANEKPLNE